MKKIEIKNASIAMKATEIIFKPIPNFEEYYEISNTGIVRSIDRIVVYSANKGSRKARGKVIKTRVNNWGYVEVRLSKGNHPKTTCIHILVAQTFIPNPANKLEVNHKNGCKTCNEIENLEWVTHKENVRHAYSTGLVKPKGKAVYNRCLKKGYTSIKAAAADNNISYEVLKKHLRQGSANPTCFEYRN